MHTIPMPMALKTLVGSAPVGAPTDAKVLFFRLRVFPVFSCAFGLVGGWDVGR